MMDDDDSDSDMTNFSDGKVFIVFLIHLKYSPLFLK